LLKNDGRERSSKKSKKDNISKRKLKKVKCLNCKELVEYQQSDIQNIGKTLYVECNFCGSEVVLK
jgi:DNA-directed RNA polymerase subunit RPC12/RpoP